MHKFPQLNQSLINTIGKIKKIEEGTDLFYDLRSRSRISPNMMIAFFKYIVRIPEIDYDCIYMENGIGFVSQLLKEDDNGSLINKTLFDSSYERNDWGSWAWGEYEDSNSPRIRIHNNKTKHSHELYGKNEDDERIKNIICLTFPARKTHYLYYHVKIKINLKFCWECYI
jgi:hypothetical protein